MQLTCNCYNQAFRFSHRLFHDARPPIHADRALSVTYYERKENPLSSRVAQLQRMGVEWSRDSSSLGPSAPDP